TIANAHEESERRQQEARARRETNRPLGCLVPPKHGAQGHPCERERNRQSKKEMGVHHAASPARAGAASLVSAGRSTRGSAARIASVSRVPRRLWAPSKRTTAKATKANEITMAVRISA